MDIGSARYVSFTTVRRNGEPVATPVWIAPLGDGRLGFTTGADSWKVKRLRANPEVTLQPCDVRGRVAAGTAPISATAVVAAEGPDHERTVAAIADKYGLMVRLLDLGDRLKRLVGRSGDPVVAVVITLP
jgi:PPOX class probable F420-dependent enzyme